MRLTAHARTGVSWAAVAGALGVGFITAFALLNSKKAAVSASSALQGDWFDGLFAEHRRIERLFKQITETTDTQTAKRGRLLEALNALLTRHSLQKENVLYPALRGHGPGLVLDPPRGGVVRDQDLPLRTRSHAQGRRPLAAQGQGAAEACAGAYR